MAYRCVLAMGRIRGPAGLFPRPLQRRCLGPGAVPRVVDATALTLLVSYTLPAVDGAVVGNPRQLRSALVNRCSLQICSHLSDRPLSVAYVVLALAAWPSPHAWPAPPGAFSHVPLPALLAAWSSMRSRLISSLDAAPSSRPSQLLQTRVCVCMHGAAPLKKRAFVPAPPPRPAPLPTLFNYLPSPPARLVSAATWRGYATGAAQVSPVRRACALAGGPCA